MSGGREHGNLLKAGRCPHKRRPYLQGRYHGYCRAVRDLTNTATTTDVAPQVGEAITFEDTEEITVVGYEEAGGVAGGGGGAAPINHEGDQESEAGEIDQSFDIS